MLYEESFCDVIAPKLALKLMPYFDSVGDMIVSDHKYDSLIVGDINTEIHQDIYEMTTDVIKFGRRRSVSFKIAVSPYGMNICRIGTFNQTGEEFNLDNESIDKVLFGRKE